MFLCVYLYKLRLHVSIPKMKPRILKNRLKRTVLLVSSRTNSSNKKGAFQPMVQHRVVLCSNVGLVTTNTNCVHVFFHVHHVPDDWSTYRRLAFLCVLLYASTGLVRLIMYRSIQWVHV